MSSFADRAERLAPLMRERSVDLLLVTNLVNVRYLCGFSGTNGLCLVGPAERLFMTDFRYFERARAEVPDYERLRGKQDLLESVTDLLKDRGELRLGFDDAHLTVRQHSRLADLMPPGGELVEAGGLVEQLRAVKDESEIAAIRGAAAIADDTYSWLIERSGLAGQTERGLALVLERRAKEAGAEDVAFPVIVAAGANGALPHSVPGNVEIPRDTLVVVDLGCVVDGYCSDCTRTFATGSLDDEAREVYELVRSALALALTEVRAGVEARAVDAVSRDQIEQAGRGDQFGHGTGHGVGLEVHEAPRLALSAEDRLEAGNVVTVEPGVYVPDRFGVRIEDLVLVEAGGNQVLTAAPRELIVL